MFQTVFEQALAEKNEVESLGLRSKATLFDGVLLRGQQNLESGNSFNEIGRRAVRKFARLERERRDRVQHRKEMLATWEALAIEKAAAEPVSMLGDLFPEVAELEPASAMRVCSGGEGEYLGAFVRIAVHKIVVPAHVVESVPRNTMMGITYMTLNLGELGDCECEILKEDHEGDTVILGVYTDMGDLPILAPSEHSGEVPVQIWHSAGSVSTVLSSVGGGYFAMPNCPFREGCSGVPAVTRQGKLLGFFLGYQPHGVGIFRSPVEYLREHVLTEKFAGLTFCAPVQATDPDMPALAKPKRRVRVVDGSVNAPAPARPRRTEWFEAELPTFVHTGEVVDAGQYHDQWVEAVGLWNEEQQLLDHELHNRDCPDWLCCLRRCGKGKTKRRNRLVRAGALNQQEYEEIVRVFRELHGRDPSYEEISREAAWYDENMNDEGEEEDNYYDSGDESDFRADDGDYAENDAADLKRAERREWLTGEFDASRSSGRRRPGYNEAAKKKKKTSQRSGDLVVLDPKQVDTILAAGQASSAAPVTDDVLSLFDAPEVAQMSLEAAAALAVAPSLQHSRDPFADVEEVAAPTLEWEQLTGQQQQTTSSTTQSADEASSDASDSEESVELAPVKLVRAEVEASGRSSRRNVKFGGVESHQISFDDEGSAVHSDLHSDPRRTSRGGTLFKPTTGRFSTTGKRSNFSSRVEEVASLPPYNPTRVEVMPGRIHSTAVTTESKPVGTPQLPSFAEVMSRSLEELKPPSKPKSERTGQAPSQAAAPDLDPLKVVEPMDVARIAASLGERPTRRDVSHFFQREELKKLDEDIAKFNAAGIFLTKSVTLTPMEEAKYPPNEHSKHLKLKILKTLRDKKNYITRRDAEKKAAAVKLQHSQEQIEALTAQLAKLYDTVRDLEAKANESDDEKA